MKVIVIGSKDGFQNTMLQALQEASRKGGFDLEIIYDNSEDIRGLSFDKVVIDELVNFKLEKR